MSNLVHFLRLFLDYFGLSVRLLKHVSGFTEQ